jgi:hypothetical protein
MPGESTRSSNGMRMCVGSVPIVLARRLCPVACSVFSSRCTRLLLQDLLPGFREAAVLFGFYVAAEYAFEKSKARAAVKAEVGAAAAHATTAAHSSH